MEYYVLLNISSRFLMIISRKEESFSTGANPTKYGIRLNVSDALTENSVYFDLIFIDMVYNCE